VKVHGLAEPDLLAGTLLRDNGHADAVAEGSVGAEAPPDAEALSTRSHSSLSSVVRKKGGGFLNKLSLKTQRWKRKSAPPEASEVSEALVSPSQSIGDDPETEVGSTSGVVAGLSQMFEDLSGRKSSTEKRIPSRNSVVQETDKILSAEASPEPEAGRGTLPLEIQTYNSSSTSSHQTAIIR